MTWDKLRTGAEARLFIADIARRIRADQLDLGRKHYALSLAMGVLSAIFCNIGRLAAVEFGVAGGAGLLDLCKAAAFFRAELGMEIDVYGFDNATGLPAPADYRDLPEVWQQGDFLLPDPALLRGKLPPFAHLVIGDIADTRDRFANILGKTRTLGFVSIDVDFYSSAKPCLDILRLDAASYMPAVPMFFDDILPVHLTYNSWVGESLAIAEFNQENALRKIEANPHFNIAAGKRSFHACHVLDSPYRTGERQFRRGFSMRQLTFV